MASGARSLSMSELGVWPAQGNYPPVILDRANYQIWIDVR